SRANSPDRAEASSKPSRSRRKNSACSCSVAGRPGGSIGRSDLPLYSGQKGEELLSDFTRVATLNSFAKIRPCALNVSGLQLLLGNFNGPHRVIVAGPSHQASRDRNGKVAAGNLNHGTTIRNLFARSFQTCAFRLAAEPKKSQGLRLKPNGIAGGDALPHFPIEGRLSLRAVSAEPLISLATDHDGRRLQTTPNGNAV